MLVSPIAPPTMSGWVAEAGRLMLNAVQHKRRSELWLSAVEVSKSAMVTALKEVWLFLCCLSHVLDRVLE